MEWIDQNLARLDEDDEIVEGYFEQAKNSIQGRGNAKSIPVLERELEEENDLGPGDDLDYKALKLALDRLEESPEVDHYRDIENITRTAGSKQFYIE